MRRATWSERVATALPVTILTSGSVISAGGGGQVGMVLSGSGCVGVELLGVVGGVAEVGVCIW